MPIEETLNDKVESTDPPKTKKFKKEKPVKPTFEVSTEIAEWFSKIKEFEGSIEEFKAASPVTRATFLAPRAGASEKCKINLSFLDETDQQSLKELWEERLQLASLPEPKKLPKEKSFNLMRICNKGGIYPKFPIPDEKKKERALKKQAENKKALESTASSSDNESSGDMTKPSTFPGLSYASGGLLGIVSTDQNGAVLGAPLIYFRMPKIAEQ